MKFLLLICCLADKICMPEDSHVSFIGYEIDDFKKWHPYITKKQRNYFEENKTRYKFTMIRDFMEKSLVYILPR